MKVVLSCGVGVQSSTLAFLADDGLLTPNPDCGVFSDTHDEPQSVYGYLQVLRDRISFPIHKVGLSESLSNLALKVRTSKATGLNYLKHHIPVFVLRSNGKHGMMQRHCTLDTKIEPIRRYVRDHVVGRDAYLKWRRKHKAALQHVSDSAKLKQPPEFSAWQELQANALVSMWIGISTDEADRAKDSAVPWIVNRHPLLELNMSRQDCLDWCADKKLPPPPKSSCAYCPYHDDNQWLGLIESEPEAFKKAVEFEKQYQKSFAQCGRLDGTPFLHASRVPLSEVRFVRGAKTDHSQTPCEGMCGL